MSDTILMQDVIDAIAGERLIDATTHISDVAYEHALDDVLKAIKAIPRQPDPQVTALVDALQTISDDNCLDPWAVARAALAKAGGQHG